MKRSDADEILARLKPLVGLKLSIARRAADLRGFHFGEVIAVEDGSIGEYALHVQCPWRIEDPGGIVTGRSDLWKPERRFRSGIQCPPPGTRRAY